MINTKNQSILTGTGTGTGTVTVTVTVTVTAIFRSIRWLISKTFQSIVTVTVERAPFSVWSSCRVAERAYRETDSTGG